MDERMIMSGFGGQGLMTLGKFVAELMMDDYDVTFFPSYGTEVRGGTAYCHVIISDEEIASPVVEQATCLVLMNQVSYDRFAPLLEPEGLLVINKSMVEPTDAHGNGSVLSIDASGLATRLGDVRVANMILLGAMNKVKHLTDSDRVMALIEKILGKQPSKARLMDLNKQAVRLGESLVENT